jgi:hypothetical protein
MDDDIRARFEQLDEAQRTDHDALLNVKAVLMGPNGDNGLRSEFKELKGKFFKALEEFQHKWDVERVETCIGCAALETYKAEVAAKEGEVTELKVAEINAGAVKAGANWTAIAQMAVAILTLAGVLIVAFKK